MADSLFNIFGDHLIRQAGRNVGRQPLSNNENMGKVVTGPVKPNEPLKKDEVKNKKSFLSNTGKALQSTPARQVFSPRAVNVGALIYSDADDANDCYRAEIEFTKPTYKYDNFHTDMHDYLMLPLPEIAEELSPPNTPPPAIRHSLSMEFDESYHDEFFTDNFSISNEYIQDEDLGLPDIY